MTENTAVDFSSLKKHWPSPYVERQQVARFSGGILHPRTLSNLDSRGQGCPGRIRVGKKIAYPVDKLIEWLEQRSSLA